MPDEVGNVVHAKPGANFGVPAMVAVDGDDVPVRCTVVVASRQGGKAALLIHFPPIELDEEDARPLSEDGLKFWRGLVLFPHRLEVIPTCTDCPARTAVCIVKVDWSGRYADRFSREH